MKKILKSLAGASFLLAAHSQAAVVLYDQDFESPNSPFFVTPGWVDLNISPTTANDFYGTQQGASFAQQFTVEVLNVTGPNAWGTGYSDPSGQGGNYALGMLDGNLALKPVNNQNDLLAVTFDAQGYGFFNWSVDFSNIGIQNATGLNWDTTGLTPSFEFTLFSEQGANGLGEGTILGQKTVIGTPSAPNVFDWTTATGGFDVSGDADSLVTLRIDMLTGYYGALDNFLFVASDTQDDLGQSSTSVPTPSPLVLMMLGLMGAVRLNSRR